MTSESDTFSNAADGQLDPGPVWRDLSFRVAMTASCRDCDGIPKVAGAGSVVEETGRRVQIMHNGIRVIAGGYDGDWMTEIIRQLNGHHEPQEELVFHEILKALPERATMIELGGYWSYYSLWFLQSTPEQRRAIVVEPDPHHIGVGQMNASLNSRNIEFIQACVGETASDQIEFSSQTSGPVLIPQVSVPNLMRNRNIEYLDLLHCDIQGGEFGVVKSCAQLFREKRIRFGIFSTHARDFSNDSLTHQRCLAMLRACGAQILAEHEVHESFSGDGLIAAYFGSTPLEWPTLKMSYNRYSNSLFRNPLYDVACSDQLQAANILLEQQIRELRTQYANLNKKYLNNLASMDDKYKNIYELFRLAQRRPTRLLRRHVQWKLNRFLLRFASILPARWVKGMRRRAEKYRPLPRLGQTENADFLPPARPQSTRSASRQRRTPGPLRRFFTAPKYRKQMTSKFLLFFSPVLTDRFKRRMRRRYEKNQIDNNLVVTHDDTSNTNTKLTDSAQSIFKTLESYFSSTTSIR